MGFLKGRSKKDAKAAAAAAQLNGELKHPPGFKPANSNIENKTKHIIRLYIRTSLEYFNRVPLNISRNRQISCTCVFCFSSRSSEMSGNIERTEKTTGKALNQNTPTTPIPNQRCKKPKKSG